MQNPFEAIDARLSNIENLILSIRQSQLPPHPEEYITRDEVCKMMHITAPTLLKHTLDNKLKGYRMGRRVLYKRNEIMQAAKEMKMA